MELREISVRYKKQERLKMGKIHSSRDTFAYIDKVYRKNPETQMCEYSYAIYLNRANRIIGHKELSRGSLAGCMIDPKMVFVVALKCMASSVILIHNHPSGNINPSQADKNLTSAMLMAGELLDVKVLDHIIYTHENKYFSFADEDILI